MGLSRSRASLDVVPAGAIPPLRRASISGQLRSIKRQLIYDVSDGFSGLPSLMWLPWAMTTLANPVFTMLLPPRAGVATRREQFLDGDELMFTSAPLQAGPDTEISPFFCSTRVMMRCWSTRVRSLSCTLSQQIHNVEY